MTDRTPTGDLRERLAEALREAAYICPGDECPHSEDECGENEPIVMAAAVITNGVQEATWIDGEVTAIADAVLPVVQDETAALLRRAETGERSAAAWQADARLFDENSDYWRKRAEVAERERDDYHHRFTNQMAAGSELVEKLQQAEAAVRRVRGVHNGGSAENTVLCVACYEVLPCPTLRALDAEQPKETP